MNEGWNVRRIYAVSELTAEARIMIEERYPLLWVEGEVSNFRRPSSGHWYFTLKDDRAQLRCAMFMSRNRFIRQAIRDGMQVVIRGRLSLYEGRGDFQAIVDHIEPAGEGELRAAFDRLKLKLDQEGLFATDRKRALPAFPLRIAIVSSPSGAALHDVLAVLRRRFPCVDATCLPVAVQGVEATPQIVEALDQAEGLDPPPDVILLTRGGGSLEDLMAFNSESVARRIANCAIPIVSAIGHETDVTIADFVADRRAPTPSAAAEMVTPDRLELMARLRGLEETLAARTTQRITTEQRFVAAVGRRVVDPARSLEQQLQRADDLRERLLRAAADRRGQLRARVTNARRLLGQASPAASLQRALVASERARRDLVGAAQHKVDACSHQLRAAVRAMNAVSPLATLDRGYAIVVQPDSSRWGKPISDAARLRRGDRIRAHLASGTVDATVLEVSTETIASETFGPIPET